MTPHQKTIVALGAFAVTLLVFTAFILLPLMRGIKSDSARVLAARQELSQVSMVEEQIKRFEALSKTREGDVTLFQNLFVDRKTPIAFIEFLETYSQNSQVSLKINPVESAKSKEDAWDSIDFELTGKGTLPSVLSFMKQVENAPYLLEFKNVMLQRLVSLREISRSETTGETSFSFLLKVYAK